MRIPGILVLVVTFGGYCQQPDLLKVKELNERASRMLSVDRDSANALSKESFYLNANRYIEEKVKNLLVIGMCQKFNEKYDSAYTLFSEVEELALELGMKRELGLSHWYKAKVWHETGEFEKSKVDYLKASDILEKSGEYEAQFKVLNGLGVIQIKQDNYAGALESLKMAYEIVLREGFVNNHNRVLNNIGYIYELMGDFEKALDFNRKALNVSDTMTSKGLIVEALINRAKLFEKKNEEDSSLYYFGQALKYCDKFELDSRMVNASLGYHHYQRGEYELSILNFRKNLESQNESGRDLTLLYLCKNYEALGDVENTLHFALKAQQFSSENGFNRSACEASKILSTIYSKTGQFQLSNKFLLEYTRCMDLIYNSEEEKKLADLRVQIETIEKANEIEALRSEAHLDQLNRILIVRAGSLIVLVLFVGIILIYIRSRHFRKAQIQKAVSLEGEIEKSRKDLHTQAMHLIRVNNSVLEIEEKLRELKPKVNGHSMEVQRLINTIRFNKSQEKEWENFDQYFDGLNSGFTDKLRDRFPTLTLNELRLCSLLRMNLMNGEIASILNVETKSVTMKKYRLKKKIGLTEDENLVKFLTSDLVEAY